MAEPVTDALQALQDSGVSLAKVMQALKGMAPRLAASRAIHFGISAAITADALKPFLQKHAALAGVRADVTQGGFDDPLGDMDRFTGAGVTHVVLMPFLDAILPHLESRAALLDTAELDAKEAEFTARLTLTLQKAAGFEAVFVCGLHRISRAPASGHDAVQDLLNRFNQVLRTAVQAHANARWIDTAGIVQSIGLGDAIDTRFYYRAKAPYSPRYLDALAAALSVASRGFGSYFYKVLVLDCDNTLWGGIVGEDGLDGIKLDPFNYPGNVFWRVQQQLAQLQRQGVLLCLCTKNNAADVQEMLDKHPSMVLKPEQIVVSKVNWQDKPQNLREIAAELNLGLDSFIFVDDSDFECNAVRSQLPQVKVLQVPANLPDYPGLIEQAAQWLTGAGVSAESLGKTEQYRMRAQALAAQAQFGSQDEYLRSLQLQVTLTRNARDSVARISELSQKSNQFNLTTRRYTEADIRQLMDSADHAVYSLVVQDRFGNAGLTGVVVMAYDGDEARVDNFFMSCRVIGRGVEHVIWRPIADDALHHGCRRLTARYLPSAKNALVARFYDELGLPRADTAAATDAAAGAAGYALELTRAGTLPPCNHIELTYVG